MNSFWNRLGSTAVIIALGLSLSLSCSKKKKEDESPAANADGAPGMDNSGISEGLAADAKANLKSVFFALDQYTLSSAARNTLQGNAKWLKEHPTVVVQVEGHCDERGSIEYNLALGDKRANSVINYLKQLGIDSSRMSAISYGEERPVDPDHSESAWAKNRRSEFTVLSQ